MRMPVIKSSNPHDPLDSVTEVEAVGKRQLEHMLQQVDEGARSWRRSSALERQTALLGIAREFQTRTEEIATLVAREVGKPIVEARGEVERAISIAQYFAQVVLLADGETIPATDGKTWLSTRRRPVGVVAAITPWNFPIAIPAWKVFPALAFGNSVVLKPASQAVGCAEMFSDIVLKHVPTDVFNVAYGGADAARQIIRESSVAAVTFTGSTNVGRSVIALAAERSARVQVEMGGQNASIVLADADVERAAKATAYAAMSYAGQKCTATSRIIAERAVMPELREALLAEVSRLAVGDPMDEATVIGPVISAAALDDVHRAVSLSGGRILMGGQRDVDMTGFHIKPTVLELADREDILAREEVFGPVVSLMEVSDGDEAIEVANSVGYGLSAALFTKDLSAAMTFVDRVEAGMIKVNAPTAGVDFHAPFGGVKASSYGPREQGMAAREFFTETYTISVTA
ncbi:aldehyde dehydrogenase family protein [Ornithinimicrobium murale]|uniref:aldehyde dehydrogenase family protein n=1 Tax=Ornithinimicrobium murale TaxID=1050153 RepID=UPI000E0DE266|nr:aldehyde dehydrogenase family protein [Ornithinimicrobium murale]